MKLCVHEVTLLGADEKGRFTATYLVYAANKLEAEALGRASAALRDFAVLDAHVSVRVGIPVDGPADFPRVLTHGDRRYVESGT